MKKLFKILGMALGAVVLLLVAAVFILPKIIDPNDYKTEIASLIEKNTGYRVDFQGPISLEVLPSLKLNLQDVLVLPASSTFGETPLARVKEVDLHMALFPLLSKRIEVESVLVNGAELNMLTNRQGANSWDMPKATAPAGQNEPSPPSGESKSASGSELSAQVGELRLSECRVAVKNDLNGHNFGLVLNSLELKNVGLGQSMDLLLDLVYDDKAANQSLGVKLNGQAKLDPAEHAATLDIPSLAISLRGPTQKTADTVSGKFTAKARFAGAEGVPAGLNCLADVNMELGDINLDNFLARPAAGARAASSGQAAQSSKSGAAPSGGALLKGTPLEACLINTQLAIKSLTIQKIPLQNIKGSLSLNKGVADLKSFTLTSLDAQISASGKANLLQMKPPVNVTASVKGLNLQKVAQTLADTSKITGKISLETALSFKGLDGDSIKRSLNGNGRLSSDQGSPIKLQDFQLIPAEAPAELLKYRQSDYVFDNLSGSFTATNGLVRNNDLALSSSKLGVKGAGTVNLPGNSIDYKATILLDNKLTLPVKASGPLDNMSYGLDAEALGKQVASGVLQELEKSGKLSTGDPKKDEALQNLGKGLQQIMGGGKK